MVVPSLAEIRAPETARRSTRGEILESDIPLQPRQHYRCGTQRHTGQGRVLLLLLT